MASQTTFGGPRSHPRQGRFGLGSLPTRNRPIIRIESVPSNNPDAYQIYRGMDIGTAKPTLEERRGVAHHLIDVVEPSESFTVSDWLAAAEAAIADIKSRGRIPVVVGGTHLYIKSLLDGLFEGPDPDPALREELRATPAHTRRAELERVDPAAAARIHPNDGATSGTAFGCSATSTLRTEL